MSAVSMSSFCHSEKTAEVSRAVFVSFSNTIVKRTIDFIHHPTNTLYIQSSSKTVK